MKPCFTSAFSLALLLLFIGCKKFDYNYGLDCRINNIRISDYQKATLVLTDEQGKVFYTEDITGTGQHISTYFTLNQKKPTQHFDAHIICEREPEELIGDFTGIRNRVEIYSHIGLTNAGSFHISPEITRSLSFSRDREVILVLDSAEYHIVNHPNPEVSSAGQGKINLKLKVGPKEGIMIEKKTANSTAKLLRFLPHSELADVNILSANHFTKPYKTITCSANNNPENRLSVYLFSPENSEFVCINWYDSPQSNQVYIPEGVPTGWQLYTFFHDDTRKIEQLFSLDVNEMKFIGEHNIKEMSYQYGVLNVSIDNGGDWLHITSKSKNNVLSPHWQIEGHPDRFKNYELPDLSEFMPDGVLPPSASFDAYTLRAHYFKGFDYQDALYGIPWKSNSFFTPGEKGYEVLWSW